MMPNQRDIVLVPVPFTDLSTSRKRPVIVISNDTYHHSTEDMVVVAMTSNLIDGPYSFVISSTDLESGTLKRDSRIRVDKIYTLSQKLAIKVFGRVKNDVLNQIQSILKDLVS